MGLNVVELQEGPLRAPPSAGTDVAALPVVAPPDRALDFPRDLARAESRLADGAIRPGTDRRTGTRPRRRPELLLLDPLEQQGQGPVENGARISVRDLAAEKPLKPPKLLVRLLANGELHPVALRRRGL